MATIESNLAYPDAARRCCSRGSRLPQFEKDYSLHLEGVMTREEHLWALNELDEVVKKYLPRVIRAFFVYALLSIVPWLAYPILMVSSPVFNPWIIAVPVVLQLLNVAGFVWWVRKKRACLREGLINKAAAINAHFAGRGVNFVIKHADAHQRNGMDKLVIEVAPRASVAPHHMPQLAPQPFGYPGAMAPQHVEHLPAHAVAIPMHNYAQNQQNQQNAQYAQYAAEYYPSEAERENAGLLQKM